MLIVSPVSILVKIILSHSENSIMKISNLTKKDLKNKSVKTLISNFRTEYITNGLNEKDMSSDPIVNFEKWFDDAVKNNVTEPNIMHLATVDSECKPSGRIVLLKSFDENGFVFFTNYESKKGTELGKNNNASLTFLWHDLYRQVRIEGKVHKISSEESDEYFQSRPKGSQISAVASAQSRLLPDRNSLEEKVKELEEKYKNEPVPRPENWGGYCLKPDRIEFWQGRLNRLHDRLEFELQRNNSWKMQRLYP